MNKVSKVSLNDSTKGRKTLSKKKQEIKQARMEEIN